MFKLKVISDHISTNHDVVNPGHRVLVRARSNIDSSSYVLTIVQSTVVSSGHTINCPSLLHPSHVKEVIYSGCVVSPHEYTNVSLYMTSKQTSDIPSVYALSQAYLSVFVHVYVSLHVFTLYPSGHWY